MKRLSWKYIAGLIDGEGTIDFQRTRAHDDKESITLNIRVRITLTKPSMFVLESLSASFGGALEDRSGSEIYKTKTNWQPAVTWALTGSRAYGLLQNIKQHLLIKKNQAEFAMQYYDSDHRGSTIGKHLAGEERERTLKFRNAVYDAMKAMKQDPHRLSDLALLWKQSGDAIVEVPEMV